MENRATKYMNPYLAGFLLGIVLLASFYLTREGLGASGGMKSIVATTLNAIAPSHAANSTFFAEYLKEHSSPLKARLVFMILGVLIGGFLSGLIMGRLKLKVEHSPKIKSRTRLIAALCGGFLFGLGAQFARGCTSGAALSGMASMALAGFLAMLAIFGTGYMFAYFVRKLWI